MDIIQLVPQLGTALWNLKTMYDQHAENRNEIKELQSFIQDYDEQIPLLRQRFEKGGGNVMGIAAFKTLERDVMEANMKLERWSRNKNFFRVFNSAERMQELTKLHSKVMASVQKSLGIVNLSMLLKLQDTQATILKSNVELKSLLISSIGSIHGTVPVKVREEVVEASTSSFADPKFWEDVLAAVDKHNVEVSLSKEKDMYEDPITANLMIDPIVASDGNTYCRWTIIDHNMTTNPINKDEDLTILIDNLSFRRDLFKKFPEQAQIFRQRRNEYRNHALSSKAQGFWGDAALALHYVLQWDKRDVECVEALKQVQKALQEVKEKYLQPSTGLSNEKRKKTLEEHKSAEQSGVSQQPSGGPESSSALEMQQPIDVRLGHKEHSIKDNQDNLKGTCVPEQQKKSLGSGFVRKSMASIGNEKKEGKDIFGGKQNLQSLVSQLPQHTRFTRSKIRKMTNNFNKQNIIDDGEHYTVYKGIVTGQNPMVAVVRFRYDFEGAFEAFKVEMETGTSKHCKHLVALEGYCLEPEPTLIYEYPNEGRLFDHLHGTPMKESALDWWSRLCIAESVAKGLMHLHAGQCPSIIHRNVTSRNILLPHVLGGKLGGYELTKLVSETQDVGVKAVVVGTIGYIDPEYGKTGCVSTKSDVYSFGVLLLELITGKLPFDESMRTATGEDCHIVHWVMKKLQYQLDPNNIDAILAPEVKASNPDMDGVKQVQKLAMRCVQPTGASRPRMVEVVRRLTDAWCVEYGIGG